MGRLLSAAVLLVGVCSVVWGGSVEVLLSVKGSPIAFPIQVSRDGHLITWYFSSTAQPLIVSSPEGHLRELAPPNGQRFTAASVSNWGFAAMTDEEGHLPARLFASVHEATLDEVTAGTGSGDFSNPLLSDVGLMVYASRDTNSHGWRDVFQRHPGKSPVALPDLEEDSVQGLLVDSKGRIVELAEFAAEGHPRRAYRYEEGVGWELFIDTLGSPSNPEGMFDLLTINPKDDFIFTTFTRESVSQLRVWLNLYESSSKTITRLIEVTAPPPRLTRLERAYLSDGGAVLAVLSGPALGDPFEVILRKPGEEPKSLGGLLPGSLTASSIHQMSFEGEVLLETSSGCFGPYSYFVLTKRGVLKPFLSRQPRPLSQATLAGDGTLYVWQEADGGVSLAKITLEEDCNRNGVNDKTDLSAGTSTDCNSNNIPDECDLKADMLTFQPSPPYFAGTGTSDLAHGDFDGKGAQDLIVTRARSGMLSLLRNKLDGTFRFPTVLAVPPGEARLPAGADLDADGQMDLLVVHYTVASSLSVFWNQGDGTFAPPAKLGEGQDPRRFAVADLDGNGSLDLAVPDLALDQVTIILNKGQRSFGSPITLSVPQRSQPISISALDIDLDGDLDLLVACTQLGRIVPIQNDGAGVFQTLPALSRLDDSLGDSIAGDLNNDGIADFAVATTSELAVLLGRASGGFENPSRYRPLERPVSLSAGDFDGDDDLDLATVGGGSGVLSVFLNRGDGTLAPSRNFAL